MTTIAANLQAVRARIDAACAAAGRAPGSVELIAISKTLPIERLREAVAAGQRRFGESYAQEAAGKIDALEIPDLEWHFVGPLQSNKTRLVAERFDWVHSIDRTKLAERLAEQRPKGRPPLQVCLQVNISGEASKRGCAPGEAVALAQEVARMPNLCLRGLMAIPAPGETTDAQRRPLAALRVLKAEVASATGLELDTLSMGMSDDLEAAIAEGATLVRVGSAIFGPRPGPLSDFKQGKT